MRKTVSLGFRNLIKKYYPGLDKDKTLSYWRFMRYLIFGRKDEKTGLPLIDQYHVAKAEEKINLLEQKNYSAEKFLIKFQQEVMNKKTFTWSDWSYKNEEARVANVSFYPEVEEEIQREVYKKVVDKRVYFDTGKTFSTKLQKVDRELIQQEAFTYFDFAAPEAKELLKYMNDLPVNSFSKVIKQNLQDTLVEAFKIEDSNKRRVYIEVLNTIRDELQPFYKPSQEGNTVRVFPFNYSIPMLKRELRKVLTRGWFEFDLASSQLAIIGKTWEIKEVQEFLSQGRKIWAELFKHYGIDPVNLKQTNSKRYEAIKSVFKDALYALIYGMCRNNLIKFLKENLGDFNLKFAGNHFLKYRLTKVLYEAREKKISELNQIGNTETIFCKKLNVSGGIDKKGNPTAQRKESIRGIMAQQAQATELYLLLPVLKLAKSTNDFSITLWQHDGFSVNFTDNSKKERWIQRIQEVVNEKAKELGIITQLEGDQL